MIHRVELPKLVFSNWPLQEFPSGLSITAESNVLVACPASNKLVEFTTRGLLVREVLLPVPVSHPSHAIQLPTGHLLVCHGQIGDTNHAVSTLDIDGTRVIASFGGSPGVTIGRLNNPVRAAVDRNGLVFVCDHFNNRVQVLSPSLKVTGRLIEGVHNPSSCVIAFGGGGGGGGVEGVLMVVESCAAGRLLVFGLVGNGRGSAEGDGRISDSSCEPASQRSVTPSTPVKTAF